MPPSLLLVHCLTATACRDPGLASLPAGPAQRIVAASVTSSEILLAIAPRERLAAVHLLAADPRFCAAASEAVGVPQVGAEPEQLLSVRPDLVIVDPYTRPETRASLAGARVDVHLPIAITSLADVLDNIQVLGQRTGCTASATELIANCRERIARLGDRAAECSAWRVLSLDGALHTYGRGSLFDDVVRTTGATHLAAERGVGPFRKLDIETVLAWRPDALVISVMPGEEAAERSRLRQTPGLELLPCVRADRLVFVPSPLLGSTSHHVLAAAELLQRQLRHWGQP